MIRLLWTKSNKPLSKLIRWCFNEPCSHFAISFDDRFVFHTDLLGSTPTFFHWFMDSHVLVHALEFHPGTETEDLVWDLIVARFDRKKSYDFGAFLYFALCAISHKMFKTKMPTKNIWGSSTSYLCEETSIVLYPIPQIIIPKNLDIVTPEQLWLTQKIGNDLN